MAERKRLGKKARFHYRKELIIDGNQRLVIEVAHARLSMAKCYLTVISKNVLTGAPIVIGPLDLDRGLWLELAASCGEVATLLEKRTYKYKAMKETEVY
jgi:hypothetical protein